MKKGTGQWQVQYNLRGTETVAKNRVPHRVNSTLTDTSHGTEK